MQGQGQKRDANSATGQFFNLLKNKKPRKDARGRTVKRKSTDYTVFGRVTKGMDIVDRIAARPSAAGAKGMLKTPPAIRRVV